MASGWSDEKTWHVASLLTNHVKVKLAQLENPIKTAFLTVGWQLDCQIPDDSSSLS